MVYNKNSKNKSKNFVLSMVAILVIFICSTYFIQANRDVDTESLSSGVDDKTSKVKNNNYETKDRQYTANQNSNKLSKEDIFKLIEISASNNFDTAYVKEVEGYSDYYFVFVTQDGFALSTMDYDMSNYEQKSAYNEMKSNFQNLCMTYNKQLKENDVDGEFVLSLLNDLNTENALLTTTENTVLYSAYE